MNYSRQFKLPTMIVYYLEEEPEVAWLEKLIGFFLEAFPETPLLFLIPDSTLAPKDYTNLLEAANQINPKTGDPKVQLLHVHENSTGHAMNWNEFELECHTEVEHFFGNQHLSGGKAALQGVLRMVLDLHADDKVGEELHQNLMNLRAVHHITPLEAVLHLAPVMVTTLDLEDEWVKKLISGHYGGSQGPREMLDPLRAGMVIHPQDGDVQFSTRTSNLFQDEVEPLLTGGENKDDGRCPVFNSLRQRLIRNEAWNHESTKALKKIHNGGTWPPRLSHAEIVASMSRPKGEHYYGFEAMQLVAEGEDLDKDAAKQKLNGKTPCEWLGDSPSHVYVATMQRIASKLKENYRPQAKTHLVDLAWTSFFVGTSGLLLKVVAGFSLGPWWLLVLAAPYILLSVLFLKIRKRKALLGGNLAELSPLKKHLYYLAFQEALRIEFWLDIAAIDPDERLMVPAFRNPDADALREALLYVGIRSRALEKEGKRAGTDARALEKEGKRAGTAAHIPGTVAKTWLIFSWIHGQMKYLRKRLDGRKSEPVYTGFGHSKDDPQCERTPHSFWSFSMRKTGKFIRALGCRFRLFLDASKLGLTLEDDTRTDMNKTVEAYRKFRLTRRDTLSYWEDMSRFVRLSWLGSVVVLTLILLLSLPQWEVLAWLPGSLGLCLKISGYLLFCNFLVLACKKVFSPESSVKKWEAMLEIYEQAEKLLEPADAPTEALFTELGRKAVAEAWNWREERSGKEDFFKIS